MSTDFDECIHGLGPISGAGTLTNAYGLLINAPTGGVTRTSLDVGGPTGGTFNYAARIRGFTQIEKAITGHETLRREVREFAELEVAPVAHELDEQSRFPWENVRKMADRGWFGVNVPEQAK